VAVVVLVAPLAHHQLVPSPEIHLEVQVVDHLLVHLLVDPEKGLAVVVAVALG